MLEIKTSYYYLKEENKRQESFVIFKIKINLVHNDVCLFQV